MNDGSNPRQVNVNVGDQIELAPGTDWGGKFEVLEIRKIYKNGVTAIVVNFHGKRKVFYV